MSVKENWFLKLTVMLALLVLSLAAYVYVDTDKLFSSVVNVVSDKLGYEENQELSVERKGRGAIARQETSDNEYEKVEIEDVEIDAGSVVVRVKDQNLPYSASYLLSCENTESGYIAKNSFGVPVMKLENLIEGGEYLCKVGILEAAKVSANSDYIKLRTSDSPYDDVKIAKTESSLNSIKIEVEEQFLEYEDEFSAKCESVSSSQKKKVSVNGDDLKLELKGLDSGQKYKCKVGILRNGKTLNSSKWTEITTRFAVSGFETEEKKVTINISNDLISGDLYYVGQCRENSENSRLFKTFNDTNIVEVNGLKPGAEYECFVSVEDGNEVLFESEVINVKTPESKYGQVEIEDAVVNGDEIEMKVKDVHLSYPDLYLAKCWEKKNPEILHEVRAHFPTIRVKGLRSNTQYECNVAVEMETRVVAESENIELETGEYEDRYEQ